MVFNANEKKKEKKRKRKKELAAISFLLASNVLTLSTTPMNSLWHYIE